jgi:hypothetical protein
MIQETTGGAAAVRLSNMIRETIGRAVTREGSQGRVEVEAKAGERLQLIIGGRTEEAETRTGLSPTSLPGLLLLLPAARLL